MKLKQSHMSKMYEHNSFGTFDVDKAIDRQKILEKERKREREREREREKKMPSESKSQERQKMTFVPTDEGKFLKEPFPIIWHIPFFDFKVNLNSFKRTCR